MPKDPDGLTLRQAAFAENYARIGIGTVAARLAGYTGKHPGSLHSTASRLMSLDAVARRIAQLRKLRAEELGVTLDFLLVESARIAASDIGRCFDENGKALPIHEIDEDTRRSIMSIETITKNAKAGDGHTDEVLRIRLWSKDRGLELAGKLSGHLVERRETGKPGDFRGMDIGEKRQRAEELARRLLSRPKLVGKAG